MSVVKVVKDQIVDMIPLTDMINIIFRIGVFLEKMKYPTVTPIYIFI